MLRTIVPKHRRPDPQAGTFTLKDRPIVFLAGWVFLGLAMTLCLAPTGALAQTQPIRVGAGSECDHDTILAALFEAAGNVGTDTIYLVNDQVYEEFIPVASDNVEIIGGFASCSDNTPDDTTDIFAPTSPGNVLDASGTGESYSLRLANLNLFGSSMVARGGVMLIEGTYQVALENIQIADGLANLGGGIYIDGSDGAELITSASEITFINNNVAVYGGGGIYCTGPANISFLRGAISSNTARGESDSTSLNAGGGVALHNGCDMESSAGGFLEGIYSNSLERPAVTGSAGGGGVAVLSGARFTASGTSTNAALISNNFSASRGGGVYVANSSSVVELRETWVVGNQADNTGGGVHVSNARFLMGRTRTGDDCHSLHRCSRLSENSVLAGGQERSAAIEVNSDGDADIMQTFIEQNSSPNASLATVRNVSSLALQDVIVAGNFGSDELIAIESHAEVNIHWSTLTQNALSSSVIAIQNGTTAGTIDLRGSIVWQPGIALVDSDHNATRTGDCVMAADFTGFPELTRTTSGPPGFMAVDDLRVTPEGNAVDYCDDASAPNSADMLSRFRPVDDPAEDVHGKYDLGAYEWRQEFGRLFKDRFEGHELLRGMRGMR